MEFTPHLHTSTLTLVAGCEHYAHNLFRRRDSIQNLQQPILFQLEHSVGLGGIPNVVQRSPAHDKLCDLVVDAHKRVDSKAAAVAGMPAVFASFTTPQRYL